MGHERYGGCLATTYITMKNIKYSKAPHTVNVADIDQTHASSRHDGLARWTDGSKYGRTFNVEGVTDDGIEYAAEVSVLLQTWEDVNADGQFVHTTDARIEKFLKVTAYIPRRFQFEADRLAHEASLTADEAEAEALSEDAAQDDLNDRVARYLDNVQHGFARANDQAEFAAGARVIVNGIKRAAVYAHLNLR